jgi:hypothetical protein
MEDSSYYLPDLDEDEPFNGLPLTLYREISGSGGEEMLAPSFFPTSADFLPPPSSVPEEKEDEFRVLPKTCIDLSARKKWNPDTFPKLKTGSMMALFRDFFKDSFVMDEILMMKNVQFKKRMLPEAADKELREYLIRKLNEIVAYPGRKLSEGKLAEFFQNRRNLIVVGEMLDGMEDDDEEKEDEPEEPAAPASPAPVEEDVVAVQTAAAPENLEKEDEDDLVAKDEFFAIPAPMDKPEGFDEVLFMASLMNDATSTSSGDEEDGENEDPLPQSPLPSSPVPWVVQEEAAAAPESPRAPFELHNENKAQDRMNMLKRSQDSMEQYQTIRKKLKELDLADEKDDLETVAIVAESAGIDKESERVSEEIARTFECQTEVRAWIQTGVEPSHPDCERLMLEWMEWDVKYDQQLASLKQRQAELVERLGVLDERVKVIEKKWEARDKQRKIIEAVVQEYEPKYKLVEESVSFITKKLAETYALCVGEEEEGEAGAM